LPNLRTKANGGLDLFRPLPQAGFTRKNHNIEVAEHIWSAKMIETSNVLLHLLTQLEAFYKAITILQGISSAKKS
jgi:hypothetical protein